MLNFLVITMYFNDYSEFAIRHGKAICYIYWYVTHAHSHAGAGV